MTIRHIQRRQIIAAAGATLACGAVFPWRNAAAQGGVPSSGWSRIREAAKKEGRVVFYATQPSTARLAHAFGEANPEIEIEFIRGVFGQLNSRIQQEHLSGSDGGDVFIATEGGWFADQARQKLLLPPQGPAFTAWPSKYVVNNTVIVAGVEPCVIPYNTKLVKVAPKGYPDLLNPEYKDKCGITSVASATLLVALYDWIDKNVSPDYLTQYSKLNPRIYVSTTGIGQAVASGEIAVSVHGTPSGTLPMMEQGAPAAFVVPKPAFGYSYFMGGFGWSKRPNAALVLMDYIMSPEGQEIWHGKGESASPLDGIKGALDINTISPFDSTAYPPEKANAYIEHWDKLFKK